MKTSHLELEHVRERTRVTRMVSRAPLRLLETGLHREGVEIQLSSYGGGVLQGDRVGLEIHCGAHTNLLLKSQANTHVYRNDTDQETIQRITATCAENAHVRVLPEPLVLHSGARFRQFQSWDVSEHANLVLADWVQSGRSESDERFAFSLFESNIGIAIDGKPIVEEHFCCFPASSDSRNPARFGPYDLMLNIYIVGPAASGQVGRLESFLPFTQYHADTLPLAGSDRLPNRLCAMHEIPGGCGYLFRAMARRRLDLQPIVAALM